MHAMVLPALAIFATLFTTTFLRSVQNKNVSGRHFSMAFIVGALMTACEMTVYSSLALSDGKQILIGVGAFGSGCGWVTGMLIHERVMRKRIMEAKSRKKIKTSRRLEKLLDAKLDEMLQERGLV